MMRFSFSRFITSLVCVLIVSGCGGGGGSNSAANQPVTSSYQSTSSITSSSSQSTIASSSLSSSQSEFKDLTVYEIANKKFVHGSYNGQSIHATQLFYESSNIQFFTGPIEDRSRYTISHEGVLKEMLLMDSGYRLTTQTVSDERVEYKIYDPNLKFTMGAVLYYENDKWWMGILTTESFESYETLTHKTDITEDMLAGISKYSATSANFDNTNLRFKPSLFQKAEGDLFKEKFLESVVVGIGAAAFASLIPPIAGISLAVGISVGIANYANFNIKTFENISKAILNELIGEAAASDEILTDYNTFTSPTQYSEVTPGKPLESSSSSASANESSRSSANDSSGSSASTSSQTSSSYGSSSIDASSSSISSSSSNSSASSQSSSFSPSIYVSGFDKYITNIAKGKLGCGTSTGSNFSFNLTHLPNMPGHYSFSEAGEHIITIPSSLKVVYPLKDTNTLTNIIIEKTYWFNSNGVTFETVQSADVPPWGSCQWFFKAEGVYEF